MKIIRFGIDGRTQWGELLGDTVYTLDDDVYRHIRRTGETFPAGGVSILCPASPGKALAIGFNYRDHAQEFHKPLPEAPNVFIKPNSCLIGPDVPVWVPPALTKQTEHECELVVVIGRQARRVAVDEALHYVFGYTCGNDVTARDMQKPDGQWSLCKGFDTFGPVGPYIETGADPSALAIEMRVNGEVRQRSNTKNLIFSVPFLISYLSAYMTLEPGDILFTGTPSGVSPISDGDILEVCIEGIGVLRNTVIYVE